MGSKKKEVKLINHDCLPILMLLCIMLYVMLAYLMLFAAICIAVCLHNSFFFFSFVVDFFKFFLLSFLTHSFFISSITFHHAQCF